MTEPTASMRRLLQGRRYATLATHNDDGSIHLTPVWYLFDADKFYVETLSTDRKARNLAARPTATIIVDIRQTGGEHWVYATGPVALLTGDESGALNARIMQRYLTDEALADATVGPGFAYAVDATICLTPTTWRSWSLRPLDEQYFGGILSATPNKWFRPLDL
jgi:PPOX class probable F420-dependent enzyme